MNTYRKIIVGMLCAIFVAVAASAQSTLSYWDFTDNSAGATTGLAASTTASQLTVSTLDSLKAGTPNPANSRGVITTLLGPTLISAASATPSASFDGKAFEVGMASTSNQLSSITAADYSLNFNVKVASGYELRLSSLTFDLGYDTSLSGSGAGNFVRPYVQLYYSLDGTNFTALGASVEPPVTNAAAFGSASGYYIGDNLGVNFGSSTVFSSDGGATFLAFDDATTVYFRMVFADNSASNSRAAFIDEITLTGSVTPAAVPEPATYALILALGAWGVVAFRRGQRGPRHENNE